jgi:hypothetical protein
MVSSIVAGPADARPGSDLGTGQVETGERALIRRSMGDFWENCGSNSTETVCQPCEAWEIAREFIIP